MDIFSSADPSLMYYTKMAYKVIMLFVIIGGINWLVVGASGSDYLKQYIGRKYASWLYIVVGICAILLAFRRDVYLPFLGETVLPGSALSLRTPQGANDSVTITTKPMAKVIYWAAEPAPHDNGKDVPSWSVAYGEYDNGGIVQADDQGKAILRIRGPPQPYKVPMKGRLAPHVHFRVETGKGMFGRIQTVYVKTGAIEGFADSI
jgi:uncharacterized membrane protein YuzA (DUF378 family)